ncbi:flavin-containing amine oxidase [Podospora aff. communis PSN243]|uniref:Flavin-containing amine oxidase n=1 Tax=Podospora aff. communis PSN243 TaxID=3040156 RepID=A0AAV9GGG1_9PEZI|nr:flavin-containing amine oxidase [Podospora aff. communis PSN243]
MEGRNHSSAAFIPAGSVSRMKEDLLKCSEDLFVGYQPRCAIRERPAGKKPQVCVIGAGLAGLRCAEVLLDGGAEVTIMEARDRIGGRIHQKNLNGQALDMGPNWIHGTDDNPVWKLAKKKASLCVVPDTMKVFQPNGEIMSDKDAESGLETVWDLIEQAFKYSNEECLKINSTQTLVHWFHDKLKERPLSEEQRARVLLLAEMWGSFIGDSWHRQSLRWFWLEECLEGENLYVMENHAPIIQHVASRVLDRARVRLSTKVVSIENYPERQDLAVPVDPKDPRVAIRTDEGVLEFDEVVVAVPLGCLQQSTTQFHPPLPSNIETAISNASYSSLEKVYITFPAAFWDTPGAIFPAFAHFLNAESYVPAFQKHSSIEMLPLSSPAVFGPHAKPTLLIYTHDPLAKQVCDLIRGVDPSSQAYYTRLNDFFKPYYSLLPNYDQNSPECTPSGFLATDWHGDDLAGNGSYTNFQASDSHDQGEHIQLDEGVRVIRTGIPERGVWFAGEHTAPFVGLGTTTGAYWSGEMAAFKVLGANGLVPVPAMDVLAREKEEASQHEP